MIVGIYATLMLYRIDDRLAEIRDVMKTQQVAK
jgi:hypothetical protein